MKDASSYRGSVSVDGAILRYVIEGPNVLTLVVGSAMLYPRTFFQQTFPQQLRKALRHVWNFLYDCAYGGSMMRKWRNPWWSLMACVALLATMLPSFAWACPMTGRIGDMATVCLKAASDSAGSVMPCCAKRTKSWRGVAGESQAADGATPSCFGTCCKPVQLPAGCDSDNIALAPPSSQSLDGGAAFYRSDQSAHSQGALPVSFEAIQPSASIVFAASTDVPPQSHHRPHTFAGRAPPLL